MYGILFVTGFAYRVITALKLLLSVSSASALVCSRLKLVRKPRFSSKRIALRSKFGVVWFLREDWLIKPFFGLRSSLLFLGTGVIS